MRTQVMMALVGAASATTSATDTCGTDGTGSLMLSAHQLLVKHGQKLELMLRDIKHASLTALLTHLMLNAGTQLLLTIIANMEMDLNAPSTSASLTIAHGPKILPLLQNGNLLQQKILPKLKKLQRL